MTHSLKEAGQHIVRLTHEVAELEAERDMYKRTLQTLRANPIEHPDWPKYRAFIDQILNKADTNRCPTCDSPQPHLHPAMQFEGEVSPCADAWHTKADTKGPLEPIHEFFHE